MKRFTLLLALLISGLTAAAQPGNALHFDGSNDQVVCGLPAVFSNIAANDFTMEAWVYPTGAIFSRIVYAQFATNNFATMSTGGTNNIYFYVVANGTNYSVATTATLPSNTWTHVATRWTAATQSVQVFFNGVLQAGAAGGSSSTGTSGLLTLGTRPGGAQYFPGAMDEVRIWAEARSQCEIQSNMNRQFTGAQTNLVSYYDFNQGVPAGNNVALTTLPDMSGYANNGTLTNFGLTAATSNWIASTANVNTSGNAVGGYSQTVNAMVCYNGSYTFPSGPTQLNITSQVVYTSNLTATNGCDSTIVTTVDAYPLNNLSDTAWVCSGGSYTFPDGSSQTNITSQVVYTSTLQDMNGCDSTIVSTVDVLPNYNLTESAVVCSGDDYLFPDGSMDTNITQTVVHTSMITTTMGCDSIIVTTVDVLPTFSQTIPLEVCYGSVVNFPDGSSQTITGPVTQTSNLPSIFGCDSLLVTVVTISVVDTSVTVAGNTLTANASGFAYQWINCNTGLNIVGQINPSFTPTVTGNYAVVVFNNLLCDDTSSCYQVTVVGIEPAYQIKTALYPNPNNGEFILELSGADFEPVAMEVVNALGQVVYRGQVAGVGRHQIGLGAVANGVYTLRMGSEDGMVSIKAYSCVGATHLIAKANDVMMPMRIIVNR